MNLALLRALPPALAFAALLTVTAVTHDDASGDDTIYVVTGKRVAPVDCGGGVDTVYLIGDGPAPRGLTGCEHVRRS